MLHLSNFVTHDYCQQSVRKTYYGDTFFKKKTGVTLFILVLFQLIIATPIGWALHFLCKLNIVKTEKLPACLNLDVPVNRFVSHAFIQIAFVVVILTVLINPKDDNCVFDLAEYNALCLAMAFGLLLSNLEEMFQLARCTRVYNKNLRWPDIVLTSGLAYCKAFFSNGFYNYRLLGLVFFLTGAAMRAIGFTMFTKYICLQDGKNYYHVIDDDYLTYQGGIAEVGTGLQGIAVVIIISQLLQFLRLHPRVSAIFEGMGKCFWDVLSYGFTYIVITLMFSAGIYFILHKLIGECPRAAGEIYESCIAKGTYVNNSTENCSTLIDTKFMDYTFKNLSSECDKMNKKCKSKMFAGFFSTTKYMFKNAFGPGYPSELEDCTSGFSQILGSALWYLYFLVVTIVLVNLLIALMNTTINNIESVDTWMYHRTLLWMRFCNRNAVVLLPPMNLINYILTRVLRVCQTSRDITDHPFNEFQYQRLLCKLATRYANDMDTFEDNDVAMRDKLDHLERVVEKIHQENNDLKEKLNEMETKILNAIKS